MTTARMLDRAVPPAGAVDRPATVPASPSPDAGHDALARLADLRDRLIAAGVPVCRGRGKEPPVFFFDPRRQADFAAAAAPVVNDPYAEIPARIERELPLLYRSVEVRRVARSIRGLRAAAETLAATHLDARELAELLDIPDDETVLVLMPQQRAGYRLAIRGIADVGQLHVLMADALTGLLPGLPVPGRFVSAYRDVNPGSPAGVPMIARARWQLYSGAALGPDGTMPAGMHGAGHWLWPSASVSSVPRLAGERTVLLGPPAFPAAWEVARRFPQVQAELRVIEVLSPFRVTEHLARLAGAAPRQTEPAAAEAA